MRDQIVVAIVLAASIGAMWLVNSRIAEQHVVRLRDIPQVYDSLKSQGSEDSFAAFLFSDRGKLGEEGTVNLQFSIEKGKMGLDWVLIGPINIRDEDRVFSLLKARGSTPSRVEQNGVSYLRTEEGDLVQLCQDIMKGLYGVKADEDIDLVPEGFDWES